MSTSKNFRVANLDNLFWDNGSFRYPNTYPRLINGWNPNKTPVLTSPTSGWVILVGDWNYCEYNGNLFFLKKAELISVKENRWKYILIKDHICSLFKNNSGVIAHGTLINTDLENLSGDDFQYTFPVFNNYNKRILIPLGKGEEFNWRKHSKKIKITKTFEGYCPWTDVEFSNFIWKLETTKDFFTKNPDRQWTDVVKNNDYVVLLGSFGACSNKVIGWKQELVERINTFLDEISDKNVAGKISNSVMLNATKLNGKMAISWLSNNPLFTVTDEKKAFDIDLSGLTDIELINFDNPGSGEKYAKDQFNLFLSYDESKVTAETKNTFNTTVLKLSRRVRVPFMSHYSSRAYVKFTGGFFSHFSWNPPFYDEDILRKELFFPQKIFIKEAKTLMPKGGKFHYEKYPASRFTGNNYRSVYLYWCFNLNFYFTWGPNIFRRKNPFYGYETKSTWIDNKDYFSDERKQNVLRDISGPNFLVSKFAEDVFTVPYVSLWTASATGVGDAFAYEYLNKRGFVIEGTRRFEVKEQYPNYYPWNILSEPINIGWLLGQFSAYIEGQENYWETKWPCVVKTGVLKGTRLKRLQGFKKVVGELIHLDDLYHAEDFTYKFTLDIFNPLSRRHMEIEREEDFLIGEKLLFTSWGMAPYLLFQPMHYSGDIYDRVYKKDSSVTGYGYFNYPSLDDEYNPQLFGKWIDYASYHYGYTVFDEGSYFKQHAKQWYKKAYQQFQPLEYERFYSSNEAYQKLKQHIVKNTEEYFETNVVDFSTNPIKELKVGDIFYSDLEWFWFDAGGGASGRLDKSFPSDFLVHKNVEKLPFQHGDIVCYINPKDNKIYLGEVSVWKDKMNLSTNHFIAKQPSEYFSVQDFVDVTYTRFSPATDERVVKGNQSFDSLDLLISALKEARYLKQNQPRDLKQLQDTGRNYLFNLKGTPFFCALDRNGKVSLIYKNKEEYQETEHIED